MHAELGWGLSTLDTQSSGWHAGCRLCRNQLQLAGLNHGNSGGPNGQLLPRDTNPLVRPLLWSNTLCVSTKLTVRQRPSLFWDPSMLTLRVAFLHFHCNFNRNILLEQVLPNWWSRWRQKKILLFYKWCMYFITNLQLTFVGNDQQNSNCMKECQLP